MDHASLSTRLGMNPEPYLRDSRDDVRDREPRLGSTREERGDFFVERDGVRFAGTHLIVDLWGASNLDRSEVIEAALTAAAKDAGATILHTHFHRFTPNGGISGVVVLAESHISIHSWPERRYAALDIFMCGTCDPYLCLPRLKTAFKPESITLAEHKRGMTL